MAITAEAFTASMADTETSATVTLSTPVPQGKGFPIASGRSGTDGTDARDSAFLCVLQTLNGSNEYTELLVTRGTESSSGSLVVKGHILQGDELTVEMVSGNITSATGTDNASITTVGSLSNTFLVGYSNDGSPTYGNTAVRMHFTTTSNVQLYRGDTGADVDYTFYVVQLSGGTVEQKLVTIDHDVSNTTDTTITEVTLANTFFVYTYAFVSASTNASRFFTEGRLTSTTNFRLVRDGGASGQDIEAAVFIVSHPSLSMEQTATNTMTATATDTETISALADDGTRFIVPGSMYGNARYSNTGIGNTQDRATVTHEFTSTTQLTFTRVDSNDNVNLTSQAGRWIASSGTQALRRFILNIT